MVLGVVVFMIMIIENVKRSMIPYGMIEGFVPTLATGGGWLGRT